MKRLMTVASLLILSLFTAIHPTPTHANTPFTVNSTVDEVDANPGDGLCVSTPSGQCTLRAAIMEANALAEADTIILPAGVYTLTIAGDSENLAMTGDLDITDDLILAGAGAGISIIDGNHLDRVMEIRNTASTVHLSDITIQGGYWKPPVYTSGGGGLYVLSSTVTIARSVVTGNEAWECGGIRGGAGTLTVTESTISQNVAAIGAGGLCTGYKTDLIQSTIYSNTSQSLAGGIRHGTGPLTIIGSAITHNVSASGVGGLQNVGGTITMSASTVMSNTGTGISSVNSGPWIPMLTIHNSTISQNTSVGFGGGLFAMTGTVNLHNITIANNSAYDGGGIYQADGAVHLKHTLIAGNTSTTGSAPDYFGSPTSEGYNLIQSTAGYTLTGVTTGNLLGINPNLGLLQNNGGPTFTHALLPGSPAIDAGNPAGCTDAGGNPLTTDQRGYLRPVDGDDNSTAICDIGAYEVSWLPSSWIYLPALLR